MIGSSSDGDNRLLSAMKLKTKFDLVPRLDLIGRCVQETICVQDTIHIGTKLRNRILNASILLCIGNRVVSTAHVQFLLNTVEKAVHALVQTDLYPEDRQNFKSLGKLLEDRVLNALQQYVVDSEATKTYLMLCKLITSAYLDMNLKPIERIYKIWYALYFIRGWRKWILSQTDYTLRENFITNNAYTCIEINAHAMIELIVKMRTMEQPNLFKPWLFASQPCEHVFRTMRSMGTANFTKINFSLNELFHMTARLEMTQKTIYSKQDIIFPRNLPNQSEHSVEFPSDHEILNVMQKARSDAIKKAAEFDICLDDNDITTTELRFTRQNQAEAIVELLQSFEDTDEETLDLTLDPEENSLAKTTANTSFSRFDSNPSSELTINIIDSDGMMKTVRKSTFIWMMSESTDKLSSDRLKRVQGGVSSTSARKKFKPNDSSCDGSNVIKRNELEIGDWALFNVDNDMIPKNFKTDNQNGHLVGNVIGFRFLDRKNRAKQYKVNYVSTEKRDEEKNVQILALWYMCYKNKALQLCNGQLRTSLDKYIDTIKQPIVQNSSGKINYALSFGYNELDKFAE